MASSIAGAIQTKYIGSKIITAKTS